MEVEPGKEADIISQLEKMQQTLIDFVHGEYDIVCVIDGEYSEIDKKVVEIRKIPHVRKTTILTAFDLPLQ